MVEESLRSQLLSRSRWRNARWLVLAPHADDETLGCGALIDEAARADRLAGVAFLTDGGGSHPHESEHDRRRLIAVRVQEARAALRILAPDAQAPIFLAWPDANPHGHETKARAATVMRLAAFCRSRRVDAIAVTGRDEPHCDHVAAFEVARAVAATAARPTAIFEYVVWAKAPPGADFAVLRTAGMNLARRQRALAQHRSQLTPIYGAGFLVPGSMRRMPAADLLYSKAGR